MADLPSVGFFDIVSNTRSILRNPLVFHEKKFRELGDTFTVKSPGGQAFILTRDAGLALHVLQKNHRNYEKSVLQTVDLARYIGHGLLTTNGDHWLTHRRMIQPGFSKKKLSGLFEMMYQAIKDEVSRVDEDQMVDVFPLMSDLAFQVVAKSLFSNDNIRKRMTRLQVITLAAQEMLIKEMRQPYLRWWFRLNGSIDKHLLMGDEARDIIKGLIEERVENAAEKDDLLDMLLAARYEDGDAMPMKQIIDEVLILFTAGHETTANALSFTLFHIAKDADLQRKVFDEVNAFDFESRDLMEAYTQLPVTKYCLEEAMRLFPPAYIMDRVAIGDDSYEDIGIQKGSMILMSLYEIQRDQRFWTKGDQYDPMRWDKTNADSSITKKESVGRYFPFGAGPRMCVGNHFAMFEMIVTIAHIVKNYRLETNVEQIDIVPLISLKPKEVPVKFVSR